MPTEITTLVRTELGMCDTHMGNEMKKMRKDRCGIISFLIVLMIVGLTGCGNLANRKTKTDEHEGTQKTTVIFGETSNGDSTIENPMNETSTNEDSTKAADESDSTDTEEYLYINADGITLEERICTPSGYFRTEAEKDSLSDFLRSYPMKADGSPVLLYNGSEKGNQQAHAAVFGLPIEAEDLQQCADSIMRVFAEYCLQTGRESQIKFYFTNGFLADYSKWRDGYRIAVNGNDISWTSGGTYDDSYESFKKYMRMVFSYAGTLSMDVYESESITLDEVKVGDVFLKGGSPGHVVMVVDVCENEAGERAFLLGQGYMPAQEFHVINNLLHMDDPWYYEDEITYPFRTAEYTFPEGSLRRLSYSEWVK